jgi:hypothetical protein
MAGPITRPTWQPSLLNMSPFMGGLLVRKPELQCCRYRTASGRNDYLTGQL